MFLWISLHGQDEKTFSTLLKIEQRKGLFLCTKNLLLVILHQRRFRLTAT